MEKNHIETIRVRAVSVGFTVLALAVFKPFGLDAWQWQASVYLLLIFVLGFCTCFLTEVILRFVARMPRSYERGIDYIIRRNLWFQLINTPLVSLAICLFRHFVLSDRVPSNRLSWGNYFETLLIIAFCSFAIGLYWRFKFRSRYLAAELEETRQLNEKLKKVQTGQKAAPQPVPVREGPGEGLPGRGPAADPGPLTLTGSTNESVTLRISQLLYIEAVGNYVKVCHLREPGISNPHCQEREGSVLTDILRATSKQMEEALKDYPMIVRSHRAFLVNLAQVEQIVAKSGSMQLIVKHSHDSIPVSRSNVSQIKDALRNV